MDFITSQAGNQMTHNRAREARAAGCLADRLTGLGAAVYPFFLDCGPGQLFYQTWCSPDSWLWPQQETHGTVPAYRPDPLPLGMGCQGREVPTPTQPALARAG